MRDSNLCFWSHHYYIWTITPIHSWLAPVASWWSRL